MCQYHSPAELCTGLDAAGVGGEYRRVWSAAGVAGKILLLYGWRTIAESGGSFISIRCRCWHGRRWWNMVVQLMP